MSDTVSIRFKGELLPGHSLDAVKAQAITLFKLTPENCNAFFSGREITLRKGLPTSELARYLERLHAAGLRVDIVPDAAVTPAASPAGTQPAVMPALAMTSGSAPSLATGPVSVPAPGADTVTCPRCQEVQPRRTLCRNCSLDIPGFLEAQAREQQEARAAAAAARDEARHGTHGAYDEEISLASFSFEGRVGRRTYLVASVLSIALFVALGLWMLKAGVSTAWVAVTLISAILNMVWGFRMAALRLHDVGVTGWACLALLIPYVGAVAWLTLLVWPGSKEGNDYGERSRPVNPLGVLGSILLTAILGAMLFSQFKTMGPEGIMELLQDSEFMEGDYEATNADDTDELDVFDGYDSSRNTLVMYSLSTCPYCAEKRQQFRAAGVRFTEYFIDTDERASEDFTARLQAHNIPSGSIGLPTIEINRVLLPNNPSLSKIGQHIRRPRS